MSKQDKSPSLFDAAILKPALVASVVKLHPRDLMKNPVMFAVELVALVATVLMVRDIVVRAPGIGFEIQIVAWLWVTLLFATFAEAVAEGRGKAQAETLRRMRSETMAKLLVSVGDIFEPMRAHALKVGQIDPAGQPDRPVGAYPGAVRAHAARQRPGRCQGDVGRDRRQCPVSFGPCRPRPVGGHGRRHDRSLGDARCEGGPAQR